MTFFFLKSPNTSLEVVVNFYSIFENFFYFHIKEKGFSNFGQSKVKTMPIFYSSILNSNLYKNPTLVIDGLK